MKQTVDVDDLEHPRGSTNRSRTTSSGRADALHRNHIVVPCVGFTTAMVQRSCSPFSSCTSRSRASELEVAQHHSRSVTKEGGRKELREVFSGVFYS
jgi:hypothetical protein